MFLSALVLAPLVAGAVAAHVLATNRAVRDTDARLQGVQLMVERAEQRAFDAAQYRLSPAVAKMAFRSHPRALERLRRTAGLGFLFVVRNGRIGGEAMGAPRFDPGVAPTARAILEPGSSARFLVEERQVAVSGAGHGLVVGGQYLDRGFLEGISAPAAAVLEGRVVATSAPGSPAFVPSLGFSDLPQARRLLCICSANPPSGVAVMGVVKRPGLFPGLNPWILAIVVVGIGLGAGLAFELARVLSRPHERALGRLEVTERLSVTDVLTGVANRRQLEATLEEETARFERYRRPFSVLMVDIDHFKRVNDMYGHTVGDRVLIEVAHRIRGVLRSELDTVARYGGEEFAVILPETERDAALVVAEKLRRSISTSPLQDGIALTVSVGVGACPQDATGDPAALLRAADEAMYQAKRSGRDRVAAGH
jgi:diguanylate cyclase (GGDEF)-like protein